MHDITSTQNLKVHFANARRERSRAFIQFFSIFSFAARLRAVTASEKGAAQGRRCPAQTGFMSKKTLLGSEL